MLTNCWSTVSIIPNPNSGSELLLQRCPEIKIFDVVISLLTFMAKLPRAS